MEREVSWGVSVIWFVMIVLFFGIFMFPFEKFIKETASEGTRSGATLL